MTEQIKKVQGGVCWYFEGEEDSRVRHEGIIEIYPAWVRLVGGMGVWVPRENVEQIHES